MFALRKFRYKQWKGNNLAEMRELDSSCEPSEEGHLHVNAWYPSQTTDLPVGGYLAENYVTGSGPCAYATEAEFLADYSPVPEE